MPERVTDALKRFLADSAFATTGAIITDLDGTAIHEDKGRIQITGSVEAALKRLHDQGRPFVLNSLRFPLSILRTFGKEWYAVTGSKIPAVTLNGSLLGYVNQEEGEMRFEETAAFPLSSEEIDSVLRGLEELVAGAIKDTLLFYYPRDWRMGEIIWTPVADKILHVKHKYVSASAVTAVEMGKLRDQLHTEAICMRNWTVARRSVWQRPW